MKLKMFQVDAFAERVFEGNPAAVCPLDKWLEDFVLQAIAEENNLSETAFFVRAGNSFELRWFTPEDEVDLCGHATLASAHVIYQHLAYSEPQISFLTRSGELIVSKRDDAFVMNFPATSPKEVDAPEALVKGLGSEPKQVLSAFDYIAVYDTQEEIQRLTPDFLQLQKLDLRGVIATAPGDELDFVSRCFFPKLRVNEDPVTGSARCELTPYWSARLGRNVLKACQLSKRSGRLGCELNGERVVLSGTAKDYMTAEISI